MKANHTSALKLIAVVIAATTFTAACSSTATHMSTTPEPAPIMKQPVTMSEPDASTDYTKPEASSDGSEDNLAASDINESDDAMESTTMDQSASSSGNDEQIPATPIAQDDNSQQETDSGVSLQSPIADTATQPTLTTFHFGFNKATLDDKDKTIVEEHGRYLAQHPDQKIVINGHSDNQGDSKYNEALSLKRADYVADLLMQQGAKKDQIEVFSWGATAPLADAHSNRDNRRVELQYASDMLIQTAHASE